MASKKHPGQPHRRKAAQAGVVRDEFRYLVVTARDRQWGIVVTAAGAQFVPPDTPFHSKGHSPAHDYVWRHGRVLHEYAIVYVLRGRGEFESELTGNVEIGEGDVILLLPDVWHRYRPARETGWDTYWVTFQGDYVDRLRERGFLTPHAPILRAGLDEMILRPFATLLHRIRSHSHGLQQLLASDTMAILAGTLNAVEQQRTTTHVQEAVRQAQLAIEAADVLPTIDELVADSGLSRSHFYQVFKNCTGVSPYQYHLQLRMSRARELLRGSALSVKQIAAILKFNSVYQFSRIFKQKIGRSPSQYRHGGQP